VINKKRYVVRKAQNLNRPQRGGRLSKPVTTGETVRLGRLVETFLVTNVGERQVICCLADFGRDLRAEGHWRGFAPLDSTSIGAKLARYPIRSDR
jgi:hypothetical protein